MTGKSGVERTGARILDKKILIYNIKEVISGFNGENTYDKC
jgi:hypothetical protein